ncbi:hypothetical protein [Cellulomonas dongxiuzhuiae]|uniref:Stress response protein n=1 Tax=Cellulomonas dongxiuzhuiae TaxID=2819979 RepID=A0ABX8GNG0_9CELL|nr:hypothetical protein [Cellulomonas dongxiuzhuiae]MBO3095891.1 hypothetical protein [Cellulomonas dongxiuzhuiae]QWC17191.1 hypothetical protein KKR89_06235 [Cellulomonas dongxiuzhuiae]
MAQESWHEARLIPTSGINGAEEQERRATSALLAVLSAVKEFGRALTHQFGAHAGTVQTYIEVPFKLGEQTVIPDGLIQVTRGSRVWTALVEVKTGQNELVTTQLENYLDVAREQGFDALLTISNEIPPVAGQHPTKVDRRKTKRVALHHLSWTQVLATAVLQKEFRGVADPDQAWILGELIRYLEHPRSGALEFEDMGASWVPVRDAVRNGTLRSSDKGVDEVANRFDALLRYASLSLGRQLGTEVTPVLSRKELADPALRTQALVATLAGSGTLSGAIRIPATVGDVIVDVDLRAGVVTCSVEVEAPREGRPTTRVNWLVRQLKGAPETVRVESRIAHQRGAGPTELLRTVRETPASITGDTAREIRSFQVSLSQPMGTKRSRGRGSFIDSVLDAVDAFYGDVVQQIKAWSAAPPRLRTDVEIAEIIAEQPDTAAALVSTAVSSQDDEKH